MLIVFWLVLSIIMVVSFDVLSFGLKRAGWDRFISTFLLFYTQVIVTEFILGITSTLTALSLSIFNIMASSLLLYVCYKKFGIQLFENYVKNIRNIFKKTREKLKSDRLWLFLLILAIILLTWIIFLGVIFPATDFDGNSYHLTFVGYAIQNHNIFDVPTSLGWLAGYPKGGELITMWNVLIANNDMLADLVQVPFLLLGIYSLYETSKRLGVKEKEARFTSLLFLFIPVVLNQLKTTYIDVILCSLFFAALTMVIKKRLNRLDLVLVGVIFSLIISIKFTGSLFIIALLPLLIWNLYRGQIKSARSKIYNYLNPLLIVFLPTLFGLYWYIKNYVLYKTPLYPFGLKILGLSIFPGKTFQDLAATATSSLVALPKSCLSRIWFVWTEQKDWFGCFYNYDSNFTGLGPIWFIIFIPAIITSFYFAIKKKNYLYTVITLGFAAIFALYPINYYSRYTMFIVAIGVFALGIILTHINRHLNKLIKSIILGLALVVIGTNFTLCNFSPGVVWGQLRTIKAGGNIRSSVFEGTIGKAYIVIEDKVQQNEVVAYDSAPYFIYDLWRPDYANKVVYIQAESKEEWFESAKQQKVKYLFSDVGSKEYHWIVGDNRVTSIYKDQQYEIFQIN